MKWSGAVFASGIYVLGLIALQAHLLRYGIWDLAALDVYYFLVGGQLLLSLLPGILTVILIELVIQRRPLRKHHRIPVRLLEVVAVPLMPLATFSILAIRFEVAKLVLDFSCYIYPKYYVLSNLAWGNSLVVLTWALIFLMNRRGLSKSALRGISIIVVFLFVAVYTPLFGRTIYPAIGQGAGGGAPQFASIIVEKAPKACLVVYKSTSGLYLLWLDAEPSQFLAQKDVSQQLVVDEQSPVHKAVVKNEVSFVPMKMLKEVRVLGMSQFSIYTRYLKERRHFVP